MVRKIKKGRGSSSNSSGMLDQLQQMQEDMVQAQEEIADMEITATAGGGAVTVVVSGDKQVKELEIAPEVVDPEDVEMLQDLVIAAINEAFNQVDQAVAERMESFTGGLGIPGLG